MYTIVKKIIFISALLFAVYSCTTYQPMSTTGGYSDYSLGNGKYKILARGNGFANSDRVRAIAYLRAAEITQENNKYYFYVLDDNLQVVSEHVGHNSSVQKDIYQLIIQPTDKGDGISAAETRYRCRNQLRIKEKPASKQTTNHATIDEIRERMNPDDNP